jgi:cysteine-rich repeat protein
MAVTLMACYGGYASEPCGIYEMCSSPTQILVSIHLYGPDGAGSVSGSLPEPSSYCGSGGSAGTASVEVFAVTLDASFASQPGMFTITRTSGSVDVYARATCDETAAAIARIEGATSQASFHVDEAGPFFVFVEGQPGTFSASVEFKPDHVCGDGVVGGMEECDDGNRQPGDGCDASCHVEMCHVLVPLVVGDNRGDTTLVDNEITSPCSGVRAPAAIYSFTPTEHGKLTASLDPMSTLAIYGVTDCANRAGPVCGGIRGVPVAPGTPLDIVVGGTAPHAVGPFDLHVAFAPSCGDGVLDPWEQCDDGNRAPGDGCDQSCHIEYGFYCAEALPLMLGENSGDTTGGSSVFSSPCTGGGASEQLYTYTAPSKGVLVLDLASESDLGLYAEASCNGAALACVNDAPDAGTQVVTVVVSAGASYFVVVDGSSPGAHGPFTLDAQFVSVP